MFEKSSIGNSSTDSSMPPEKQPCLLPNEDNGTASNAGESSSVMIVDDSPPFTPDENEEPTAEEKHASTWACNACTLINKYCNETCEICNTPRGTTLMRQMTLSGNSVNRGSSGSSLGKKPSQRRHASKLNAGAALGAAKGQLGIVGFFRK